MVLGLTQPIYYTGELLLEIYILSAHLISPMEYNFASLIGIYGMRHPILYFEITITNGNKHCRHVLLLTLIEFVIFIPIKNLI